MSKCIVTKIRIYKNGAFCTYNTKQLPTDYDRVGSGSTEDEDFNDIVINQFETYISVLQAEYEQTRLIKNSNDTKAISLMTLIIAMITVYVPIFPFKELIPYLIKPCNWCFFASFIVLGVFAFVAAIYCVVSLLTIYRTKAYDTINVESLNPASYTGNGQMKIRHENLVQYKDEIAKHLRMIITQNRVQINAEGKKLKIHFVLTVIVFIFLSVSTIGTIILTNI